MIKLNNKLEWQISNLKNNGIIIGVGRTNHYIYVDSLDTNNYIYIRTNKKAYIFDVPGKTYKKYGYKFDNMNNWVYILDFNIVDLGEDVYLLPLNKKYLKEETIKELEKTDKGVDDFEIVKDVKYLKIKAACVVENDKFLKAYEKIIGGNK